MGQLQHIDLRAGMPSAQLAKRWPAPQLQKQMEKIQRLPKTQRQFVMQMFDTVLTQHSR